MIQLNVSRDSHLIPWYETRKKVPSYLRTFKFKTGLRHENTLIYNNPQIPKQLQQR